MTGDGSGIAPVEERVHANLVREQLGFVRILRIDREDKLGALSSELLAALQDELTAVRQDRGTRVLILTGTGRGFIAGADIGEYAGASAEAFDEYQLRSRRLFEDLERLPQPTIAAVNGYALGGGFELVLCCDFLIASDRARFALPEVKLGLLPGGGGTQRLPRRAGTSWTKELVLTGRTVTAEEANTRGIVTSVVDHERLREEALAFADRLANNAPAAVREAKRLIDDGVQQDLSAGLRAEQRVLSRLFASPDGQEGIRAFVEKREPVFRGETAPATAGGAR